MKIKIFVMLILASLRVSAHPMKLSVCDISYDQGVLKMHYKLFQDDFIAYADASASQKFDFEHMNEQTTKYILEYLNKHTDIVIHKQKVRCVLKSYSKDQTLVHIWLEAKNISLEKENTVLLKNTILFDKFPEQINMYYIDFLGDKNPVSARLGKDFPQDSWLVKYK